MEAISSIIWNDDFWLPEGFTWKDLEMTPGGIRHPQFSDLYYVPIIALVLLLIRIIFERFIALPFCVYLGITNTTSKYEQNAICEKVFKEVTANPKKEHIDGLIKQLGWSQGRVQRWFRKRRKANQLPLLKKATESCWRCVFYFWLFCFGGYTILPTDWFYDTRQWMIGYIREQDFNNYMRSYYLMELGFYFSLLFSQFIDAKRKDFWQMFIHHIVTIALIFSSFAISHCRIGVVIMFIHDASDFWLEGAKVFNYAKIQKVCDGLFVMFALTFFITRWVYYPFWVLEAFIFKVPKLIGPWKGHWLECTWLIILQILHFYWGGLIVHMVYKLLTQGKVDRDTRSEDESSGDETQTQPTTSAAVNKKKK